MCPWLRSKDFATWARIARIATLPPRSALVISFVSPSPSTIPGPEIRNFAPSAVSSTYPKVILPSIIDPTDPARADAPEIDAAIFLILFPSLKAALYPCPSNLWMKRSVGFPRGVKGTLEFVGIGCQPDPYITQVDGDDDRSETLNAFCGAVHGRPASRLNTFLFSGVGPYRNHLGFPFTFLCS